jgi:hypothetical protein
MKLLWSRSSPAWKFTWLQIGFALCVETACFVDGGVIWYSNSD